MGQGSEHDEEREERDQREIGKVAGMDEPVRIDANRDPLDDVERARMASVLLLMALTAFWRFGRDVLNGVRSRM
ncbi:MAG TPA: hypothetical protein VNT42_13415 [Sphingomonas sp.]|nr:hypothetical protein [Sphingomonas sp.]